MYVQIYKTAPVRVKCTKTFYIIILCASCGAFVPLLCFYTANLPHIWIYFFHICEVLCVQLRISTCICILSVRKYSGASLSHADSVRWSTQIQLDSFLVLPVSSIIWKSFKSTTRECTDAQITASNGLGKGRASIKCDMQSKSGLQKLPLFISAEAIYTVGIALWFGAFYSLFDWHVDGHMLLSVSTKWQMERQIKR